jgi:hypothetical protein
MPERVFIALEELLAKYCCDCWFLAQLVLRHGFPQPLFMNGRVLWLRDEVASWEDYRFREEIGDEGEAK